MHPAASVILFSSASGLGFGFLAWLGLGFPGVNGWGAFWAFALAYVLAVGGLISSTFHLGNPQRALKAFTQWRTSWLSREGWLAVVALLLLAVFGAGLVFLSERWSLVGWIGAALAIATVFATSMIYAQLKTVPRWNHFTTPLLFLLLSIGGGAVLAGLTTAAILLLAAAGLMQIYAWSDGDGRFRNRGHSMESATGLGGLGTVRQLEAPHTGSNYLMKEMVHKIARKHALKLRLIGWALAFLLPLLALLVLPIVPFTQVVIAAVHLVGVLVLRWLFFAEAEHVVGLYYGAR